MRERHIVALGGGGFSMEPENPLLDDFILGLVGRPRPRVCFVGTASGDSARYLVRFYTAFPISRCEPSHLALFDRSVSDLSAFLLAKDVIYVGGGNTANLLAVWRLHGLDSALREARNAGVILCGVSAGALCWFECGVTDSFGQPLAALSDGLGFLRGSFCSHFDGEANRRPTLHRLITKGTLPAGYAADDGVGLHFVGERLHEAVASRPVARAFRVESVAGAAVERAIDVRYLGTKP